MKPWAGSLGIAKSAPAESLKDCPFQTLPSFPARSPTLEYPKIWSYERFSSISTKTCLIRSWMLMLDLRLTASAGASGGGRDPAIVADARPLDGRWPIAIDHPVPPAAVDAVEAIGGDRRDNLPDRRSR